MKYLIFFLLCLSLPAFAQEPKGVTPLTSNFELQTSNTTRAVVIGISDYQDPAIPDLQYADKDAEAFVAWLKSRAGGSVPAANIQLLTNSQATTGKFSMALFGLIETAQEGDQVIIYFSGHGDVEAKFLDQPGYLLTYDSPSKVYMIGAFSVENLQRVVSVLSLQNKARVLVITDACHAGKLAGSGIGGAQATAANLSKQFANEVKIMSCQPNEFSLEGTEWGGGRGVFSYYLLDGLTGLADQDENRAVNLREIRRYLEDQVPAATSPHPQTPCTYGDLQTVIAHVDEGAVKQLTPKPGKTPGLIVTQNKGTGDSLTQIRYEAFMAALEKNDMLESADSLYQLLIQEESLQPMYGLLRRNFAAALLDEVQQALNALLNDDPFEVKNWKFNREKYSRYPILLQRSIGLLGENNYLYKSLLAKQLFFEAYNTMAYGAGWYSLPGDADGKNAADSLKKVTRAKLHQALTCDPYGAYLHYLLGNSWLYTFEEDSIRFHYQRAMELSPGWKLPCTELAWHCMDNNFYRETEQYLSSGLAEDPDSYILLEMRAWLYQRTGPVDSVEALCRKMRAQHPEIPNDYITLSYTYCFERKYELSAAYAKRVFDLDSTTEKTVLGAIQALNAQRTRRFGDAYDLYQNWFAHIRQQGGIPVYETLAGLYLQYGKYATADSLFRLARSKTTYSYTLVGLDVLTGKTQALLGRPDSAEYYIRRGLAWPEKVANEIFPLAYAWLGVLRSRTGHFAEAEEYFRTAVGFHPELYGFNYKDHYSEARYLYGNFLTDQHRFSEAAAQYRVIPDKDAGNPLGAYGLARLYAAQGKKQMALDHLEKALDQYYPIPGPILEEPLFKKIRKTKRFKALIAKHFPETAPLKN